MAIIYKLYNLKTLSAISIKKKTIKTSDNSKTIGYRAFQQLYNDLLAIENNFAPANCQQRKNSLGLV